MTDTIFALSSGGLPSGVAIIRISGTYSRDVLDKICPDVVFGSRISFSNFIDPDGEGVIDRGLVLTFIGPNSFTGEDVVEFHVHGGRAVIDAIYSVFSRFNSLRQAEAGEFTYRAFENGKIDLTQAEGLSDLIASESEAQRIQAFDAVGGKARKLLEKWLHELVSMRALIEAEIDFVEEDDIPGSVSDQVWNKISAMVGEMEKHISSFDAGEIIRNGFRVTLLGKPNAGKSTLLNRLAGRDVAIVTDIPGTTRDLIEVRLNLGGHIVVVTDTAGIHVTDEYVEKEGIKRAVQSAEQSNMVIWLNAFSEDLNLPPDSVEPDLVVMSKSDLLSDDNKERYAAEYDIAISSITDDGMDKLVEFIREAANDSLSGFETALFSRRRQRDCLQLACAVLKDASERTSDPLELRSENLRVASNAIGKLVGRVDVEDILGVIFSEFCVGK